MTRLPDGWVWSILGEVAHWGSGGTPKADRAEYYDGTIPWAVIGDLPDGPFDTTSRTITQKGLKESSAKIVDPGSVLLAMYGSIGKLGMPTVPMATNQAIAFAIPRSGVVLQRYLYWYLRSQRGQLAAAGKGATQKNISQTVLRPWPIPLAPLDEQQRIVEAIEEQFSRLDASVESLDRAKRNLARLRASILTSAVDGRIVGLEPSAEASSAGLFPIPRGWAWQRTEDVAVVSGGIQKQPKRKPKSNAYPYLRVANVHRGALDLGEVHEMELFGDELARYRLEPGDLLVVEGNGSESQIGRSAMWGGEIQDCVHQNHIIRVRPGPTLEARFLNLFWNSPPAARRVRAVAASTSGLYTLSTSKVRAVPLPIPPLETQREVVLEVERQLSVVDAMLRAVEEASVRAGTLQGAVLRDAFSGGLGRASSGSVGATTA